MGWGGRAFLQPFHLRAARIAPGQIVQCATRPVRRRQYIQAEITLCESTTWESANRVFRPGEGRGGARRVNDV